MVIDARGVQTVGSCRSGRELRSRVLGGNQTIHQSFTVDGVSNMTNTSVSFQRDGGVGSERRVLDLKVAVAGEAVLKSIRRLFLPKGSLSTRRRVTRTHRVGCGDEFL